MDVVAKGSVGPARGQDGSSLEFRQGRDSEMIVQNAHGNYYEAVSRGNCYITANQGGLTIPAGLSASPTTVTLNNPVGSGVNGVIIYAGITFIVVFGAGAVIWVAANTNPLAAATTGTAAVVRNCLLGSSNVPRIQAFTTATLPAAPVAVAVLGAGLTGAITTTPHIQAMGRYFDGALVMAPGSALSFQASTASGASGAAGEWIWEEVLI